VALLIDLGGATVLLGGLKMMTEQDGIHTATELKLYEAILAAFREAEDDGLSWRDCEFIADEAGGEVFPGPEPAREVAP
jgi:hypothetical protein